MRVFDYFVSVHEGIQPRDGGCTRPRRSRGTSPSGGTGFRSGCPPDPAGGGLGVREARLWGAPGGYLACGGARNSQIEDEAGPVKSGRRPSSARRAHAAKARRYGPFTMPDGTIVCAPEKPGRKPKAEGEKAVQRSVSLTPVLARELEAERLRLNSESADRPDLQIEEHEHSKLIVRLLARALASRTR